MVGERRAFGDHLKRARERAGISLESIAQTTKVSASLYAALERGDCSRWPTGIYGRSYIKAYAEAIGLDGLATVKEFGALFGGMTLPNEAGCSQPGEESGALRLSMAQEPFIQPELLARRAALAAADLLIGLLIAATVHAAFSANLWTTVASVLSYFVAGRLVSDEPLLYWMFLRTKAAPRSSGDAATEEIAVADAASTA